MKNPETQGLCEKNIFTRFFDVNVKPLRNYLYYKFGDDDLADDIAQEAFIKLWQNCDSVQHPKSFVYAVANNAALNHTAHQKVVLQYAKRNPGSELDLVSPEYIAEEEEFRVKFDRAIATLTEPQRTALLMNRIEGLKYREIAEILGISIKAVEKRIHGALVTLRDQIENFR